MNKLIKSALMCVCAVMVSCGGSGSSDQGEKVAEYKVKPETVSVKGALSDCFEVVDKEYTMKKDGSGYMLTVQLKRTDVPAPYSVTDIDYFPNADKTSASMLGGFGYELLDENGDVIATHAPTNSAYSWDDMVAALRMNPGETSAIKFLVYSMDGTPAVFRISSDLQPNTGGAQAASAVETVAEAAASDAGLDEITDDLSKQMDEITSDENYKKAKDAYNTAKDLIETEKKLLDAASSLAF